MGCATFRVAPAASPPAWHADSHPPQGTIALVISGRGSLTEGVDDIGAAFERWRPQIERAYVESGLFTRVAQGLAPAQVRADIRIEARTSRNQPWYALCLFTVCTIPAVFTTDITMETTFTHGADGPGQAITMKGRSRAYLQPLLAFVAPFHREGPTTAGIVHDLSVATISRAYEQNVFRALRDSAQLARQAHESRHRPPPLVGRNPRIPDPALSTEINCATEPP